MGFLGITLLCMVGTDIPACRLPVGATCEWGKHKAPWRTTAEAPGIDMKSARRQPIRSG